jgi:hypothetical protein
MYVLKISLEEEADQGAGKTCRTRPFIKLATTRATTWPKLKNDFFKGVLRLTDCNCAN